MINNNQLTVPCVGSVKSGDSVMIITRNGEPVAVAPIGWGDAIEADISDAAQVAAEAQAVAEATGQHFFTDTDGVHVTEAEGDATTGHNILINALGILLRHAANYLTSITASAIAFYDGLGTAASNITAQFGANLARIGYEAGKHVDVTDDGLRIYDGDTQVASFGENLVEIGTDPMPSAGMASSVVSMTGGSFQITSAINPIGGGKRTTVEVVGDSGREQYLSFKDGLSYIGLRSLGTSELGAAEFVAGVRSVDEAGVAFVECSTDGTASKTKIKGDSIEMDGTVTMENSHGSSVLSVNSDGNLDISTPIVTDAVNGLYARATGTSSAANYFTLINADTGVGVQFIFNPSTRNLAVRYTTNGGTNWSSTKAIASWS